MARNSINAPGAPNLGPYSDGVYAGGLLFLSGKVGLDPETGALAAGGAAAETLRCIRNAEAVLHAAGLSLANVVRCSVYLRDMSDFEAMNEVYQTCFEAPFPARTTVGVSGLPMSAAVEIDMVAAVPRSGSPTSRS